MILPESQNNLEYILGSFGIIVSVLLLISIISYLIKAFTLYRLAKKSNQRYPWLAFIPVAQGANIYRLAGFTEKLFVIILLITVCSNFIPIPYLSAAVSMLSFIISIYIKWRVVKNFGGGALMFVLNLFFEPIVLIYLAISNREFVNTPMNEDVVNILRELKLDDQVEANNNDQI